MRNADDDEEIEAQPQIGKAEKMGNRDADDEDGEFGLLAAVLWIPDPTQRSGLRDIWIEHKKESKSKPVGFGKRR
jgi:hypothetical protein